jgi:hypothetical protein
MFGNVGAFVNGNMFMGLFGADVGVKLGDSDAASLTKAGRRWPVRTRGTTDGRLRNPPRHVYQDPSQLMDRRVAQPCW